MIQHETDHLDGVLFFDRMKSFETLTFLDEFGRYWTRSATASRSGLSSALPLERPLRTQPLEFHLRVIGELHRRGDGAVAGLLGDQRVHLLADAAVGRMALRRGAQLDDVHGLARVHLHVEPDAIGHRDGVGRDVAQAGRAIASCSSADASITRVQSSCAPASAIASGSV